MEIDRDLLKQVAAKTANKQSGIASLSRSLHKSPDTREWVTLETVALVPIPVQRLGEWGLISLLTVPKKQENGIDGYAVPWGVVEWNASTMQVTKRLDLREIKANSSLWQSKVISKYPADTSVEINSQIRTLRENFLYDTLDDFCGNTNRGREEFFQLAKHYSGILPKEIYSYYHDLVPESKEWLISDLPAIALQISSPKEQVSDGSEEKLEVPSDLTDKLLNWLNQCIEFANNLSIENRETGEQMIALLKAIDRLRSLPGFRLAFVGEFSRGKSYLINRLLGRNILPEGALPTTATITSIVAGEEDRMEVRIAGKTEIRPLEEASWEDLLATDSAGTDAEVFAGLRISLNHEWLRSLDVEIIDTPGAGDLSDRRAAMVSDILSQSDAAVLLVSATSPFSMTEAAFLEQEVIGRHVPRIMVAVSKLDTIPPEQREKVMQSIRYRIAEVAENVPILSTYPVDPIQQEATALAAIVSQIEMLVNQGDRRIWRSHQVAQQLADWLSKLIEIAQTSITALQINDEQREHCLHQAQNELENLELNWENLRLELSKRRLNYSQEIRQRVVSIKEELVENLAFDLQKTPDPKVWWEKDLPFRLRRELTVLSRKSENFLLNLIAKDVEWLQSEVTRLFNTKIPEQIPNQQESMGIAFKLEQGEITDLQRYRLLSRVGSTAAMIAGSIFGGPIGMAASTGVLLASEQVLNQKLDTQRKLLSDKLEQTIDIALDDYCKKTSERLRQLYRKIIDDMESEQTKWKTIQKASLLGEFGSTANMQGWEQMVYKASTLRQELVTALMSKLN